MQPDTGSAVTRGVAVIVGNGVGKQYTSARKITSGSEIEVINVDSPLTAPDCAGAADMIHETTRKGLSIGVPDK
jgi:hypothetical protein